MFLDIANLILQFWDIFWSKKGHGLFFSSRFRFWRATKSQTLKKVIPTKMKVARFKPNHRCELCQASNSMSVSKKLNSLRDLKMFNVVKNTKAEVGCFYWPQILLLLEAEIFPKLQSKVVEKIHFQFRKIYSFFMNPEWG